MLYDLNIPWSPNQNPLELQRTISFLSELGYDTLALNHTISNPLPSQITSPLPNPPPFSLPSKTILLNRCTLTISDPSLNHRLPNLANAYHILALRPTTEKAYLSACNTLTEHSIISLDLTQRFPFFFKPKPLMTAINRGIRFEICYAQAIADDTAARRNFISNCMAIIRGTRGRGLVVSSEAKNVLMARAPADVLNLLGVWGLARERGTESMGVNPRGVVVNEGIKRISFRGVINVIDGGESPAASSTPSHPPSSIDKKGKRKVEVTQVENTPPLSKRAEKRAKKLAKQELDLSPAATTTPPNAKISETHGKTKSKANG
jgi:ribonuclease P/MRP protein subunit RPP1